jgi:hypothetical protein
VQPSSAVQGAQAELLLLPRMLKAVRKVGCFGV